LNTDTAYLRRHYASLSDGALLEIDQTDLVEDAQEIYDKELAQRGLTPPEKDDGDELEQVDDEGEESLEEQDQDRRADRKPDWLREATVAATFAARPGMDSADYALEARDALDAAGIPCYLSTNTVDPPWDAQPRKELRLMVPGKLSFEAASVLDKEIFNREDEALWKAHFETLSDEELRAVDLPVLFVGLMDRIERATRAYREELALREITRRQ
jgi:hypothetical protein